MRMVAFKLRKAAGQLRLLPRALGLVWQAAKGWTAAWAVLLLLQGLLPLVPVYLAKPLVDGLVAGAISRAAWAAAAIAAAALLAEGLRAASGWVRANQTELVQDHVTSLIHAKSVAADLAFYDSAEFFDHLHRARIEATYRPVALLEALGSLLQSGVTLAAMFGVLVSFGLWVPAVLALGTLPALAVALRYAIRQHELRLRTTSDERRIWYYDWLLTARETAPELRLFALGESFRPAYRALRARVRNEKVGLARGNAGAELSAGVLALAVTGGSLAWVLWRAMRGLVSLGSLALFYQAFQQGLRLARSVLENAGQLYYNSLFLGNLFEFLALEPRLVSPAKPVPPPRALATGIRFDRVTFRYPGSAAPVLKDFSLTIPAGRMVAFVGPNGAGKSTFIKLLCRFYDPDEGRIEWDGQDLRSFAVDELRARIAVLFQEPVRYNTTAAENIALGDISSPPDAARMKAAAASAGADQIVAALPAGYDSLLGKSFSEGSELSAGQWQRVALARAFYRQAPILILDEPTSAMDPWAEADWLDRFRALAQGRTSILITHRFSTAMRADMIHVISDGVIVESGSHEELLAAGGLYAQSWREQTTGRTSS